MQQRMVIKTAVGIHLSPLQMLLQVLYFLLRNTWSMVHIALLVWILPALLITALSQWPWERARALRRCHGKLNHRTSAQPPMSALHALCLSSWPVSLAFTLSVSIRRYGCFSAAVESALVFTLTVKYILLGQGACVSIVSLHQVFLLLC